MLLTIVKSGDMIHTKMDIYPNHNDLLSHENWASYCNLITDPFAHFNVFLTVSSSMRTVTILNHLWRSKEEGDFLGMLKIGQTKPHQQI